MAILFFDSQRYREIASAGGQTYRSGQVVLSTVAGNQYTYTLSSARTQVILQVTLLLQQDIPWPASRFLRFYGSDGNLQVVVEMNPHDAAIYISTGATVVASGFYPSFRVSAGSTGFDNYISVVHTPGAAGSVVIRDFYGDTIVSYSGDTRGFSSSSDTLRVMVDSPQATMIVLADTSAGSISSWTKELTVRTLTPSAAGDVTQWSVSGASAVWQAINEATSNGDTNYAFTGTTGQRFLVNLTDLPSAKTGYLGVLVKNIMRRDDTVTWQPRAIVKVGGTEYSSATDTVTNSSYAGYSQIWETSPATGTPWTASEINALQSGVSSS
jgi:hypothetical protein